MNTSAGSSKNVPNNPNRKFWRPFPYRKQNVEKPIVFHLKTATDTSFSNIVDDLSKPLPLSPGWQLYFPSSEVEIKELNVMKVSGQIKAFQAFVKASPQCYDLEKIHTSYYFNVNVERIKMNTWLTFQQDLLDEPFQTLSCLGFAVHLLINETYGSGEKFKQKYVPRLVNVVDVPLMSYKSLKVEDHGQIVCVRGTIVKVNEPQLIAQWMTFQCRNCQTNQVVYQTDGKPIFPSYCKTCKGRSNFEPIYNSFFSTKESQQLLKIKEFKSSTSTNSNIGSFLEILLTDDLVDTVCLGDDVTVIGINTPKIDQDHVHKQYSILVRVINIFNNKQSSMLSTLEFSDKDLKMVQMVKFEPSPFRLLVHSLCPNVFGHEMTKAGLLLGLFSGSHRGYIGRRREAHVLIVGDPGMGKSELLQACAQVSPRGIFVSNNSSTKSGLTVTLKHDSSQKYSLEAGAVVQADQGVCCIDEFDKMSANQEVLLEVMEQQTVSVTKAGILCSLNAKTCILAAANPVGGHYDKTKTIKENLKIPNALLSRFDLVFILIDKYDESFEDQRSNHIKRLYMKSLEKKTNYSQPKPGFSGSSSVNSLYDLPLDIFLKLDNDETLDLLPENLFQKYINFARQKCLPVITPEAKLVIKEFYLKLRNQPFFMDTIPVTTRELEALIRLTQARARIELSEVATKKHAEEVIEIVDFSLKDVKNITEEDIAIQTQISSLKTSSKRKTSINQQLNKFSRFLVIKTKSSKSKFFERKELKELAIQAGVSNFDKIVDIMNENGVLLYKGCGRYEFNNY